MKILQNNKTILPDSLIANFLMKILNLINVNEHRYDSHTFIILLSLKLLRMKNENPHSLSLRDL